MAHGKKTMFIDFNSSAFGISGAAELMEVVRDSGLASSRLCEAFCRKNLGGMIELAMENGHRNSGFSHEKW